MIRSEKMSASITISSKYQIIIPPEIREKFNLKPGQKVIFVPDGKSIRLVIVPAIKDARGMLKGMSSEIERDDEDRV